MSTRTIETPVGALTLTASADAVTAPLRRAGRAGRFPIA